MGPARMRVESASLYIIPIVRRLLVENFLSPFLGQDSDSFGVRERVQTTLKPSNASIYLTHIFFHISMSDV